MSHRRGLVHLQADLPDVLVADELVLLRSACRRASSEAPRAAPPRRSGRRLHRGARTHRADNTRSERLETT